MKGPRLSKKSPEPIPGYRHPSESAYAAGCGCEPCLAMRRRSGKRRAIYGPTLVPVGAELPGHLGQLVAEGYSGAVIAEAVGMDEQIVYTLLAGGQVRLRRDYHSALLAVDRSVILARASEHARVPLVGAQRRVRALAWIGWDPVHLAEGLTDQRYLSQVRVGAYETVAAGKHRWIAELYDRHSMTRGPSRRAEARARRQGWAAPLAWDDESIDNPAVNPAELRQSAARARSNRRGHELREDIREMRGYGVPADRVCERLGINPSHAAKLLRDGGDPEMARPFYALDRSQRQRSVA